MPNARQNAWNGGGWIKPTTRLAIYLRDEWTCTYCGHCVREVPRPLSLDHVDRHGGNSPTNLTTACFSCNERRNGLDLESWLQVLKNEGKDMKAIRERLSKREISLGQGRGRHPSKSGSLYEQAAELHENPPLWLFQLRKLSFKTRRQMLLFDESEKSTYSNDPMSSDFPF